MLISRMILPRDGRFLGLASLLGAASLLSACAGTRGGPIPYDVAAFGAPDVPQAATVEDDYRIAPLDKLRISVFQVEDLSREYQVDLAGNITLPLIGAVSAVGLTADQVRRSVAQRLGQRYLNNPDVTVAVIESSQNVVTVDGSVRTPGAIPRRSRMTLMEAVAMAGGTDAEANPRRVAIFRRIEGQRMAAAFDLTSIRRGQAQDPLVYRGDIIVVDGSRVRAIQREILQSLPLLAIFRPF